MSCGLCLKTWAHVLITESNEESTEEVEVSEENILIKKNTTRSKIKILPTAEDDRARFTCEGRHQALARPQRVTVQLSVQCKSPSTSFLIYALIYSLQLIE
jgi:hypothetical protein